MSRIAQAGGERVTVCLNIPVGARACRVALVRRCSAPVWQAMMAGWQDVVDMVDRMRRDGGQWHCARGDEQRVI